MEERACPNCGGVLGGQKHALRPDSYHLPVGGAAPLEWMGDRTREALPQQLTGRAAPAAKQHKVQRAP